MKNKKIKMIIVGNYGNGHHAKNVYDPYGLCPTITAGNNYGLGVAILIYEKYNKTKRK